VLRPGRGQIEQLCSAEYIEIIYSTMMTSDRAYIIPIKLMADEGSSRMDFRLHQKLTILVLRSKPEF
jgi:hypothetical protein